MKGRRAHSGHSEDRLGPRKGGAPSVARSLGWFSLGRLRGAGPGRAGGPFHRVGRGQQARPGGGSCMPTWCLGTEGSAGAQLRRGPNLPLLDL